uniref:Uncharacterized protein n=1 Tax=Panagrolaimus sp. JU765 TaxID=591449 RepID=A0AC34RDA9_9BILA
MDSAILDGSLATTSSSSTYELSTVASERVSDYGAAEVVLFRLVALESKYFSTIRRHRYEVELPSNMTLMAAFEQILGVQSSRNVHKMKTTRIFYCAEGNLFKIDKVLELDPQKHGNLPLSQFWKERMPICIIVDFTGKVIKGKKPLFIPGKN